MQMAYASHVNRQRVTDSFLSVAKLWGPSGEEKVVADAIVDQFQAMGIPGATITVDDTAAKTHSNTGNVIIDIPASPDAPADAPALGLFFHMDRVPAQAPTLAPDDTIELVVEENGDIHSKDYQTNIAADDRAGYAEIKEAIHIVQEQGLTHGRIVVIGFTREEIDGAGAHEIDPKHLQGLDYGYYMDAEATNELMRGGATIASWQATVRGKAAHSGVNPQAGISAVAAAASAIGHMGSLGYVQEGQTLNVSNIVGGTTESDGGAVYNMIPDKCQVAGEFRGVTPEDIASLDGKVRGAFARAEKDFGVQTSLEMVSEPGFYLADSEPVVQFGAKAMRAAGLEPNLTFSMGGSDASPLNNVKGLPTVLLGNGVSQEHTVEEHINVDDLVQGSKVLVSLIEQAVR
jgi:tripeptide aminopeptidase